MYAEGGWEGRAQLDPTMYVGGVGAGLCVGCVDCAEPHTYFVREMGGLIEGYGCWKGEWLEAWAWMSRNTYRSALKIYQQRIFESIQPRTSIEMS